MLKLFFFFFVACRPVFYILPLVQQCIPRRWRNSKPTHPDKMKTLNRKENKFTRTIRFFERMAALGFTRAEADTLRKAQMTLHRWSELECGDGNDHASWAIERDEETGKPYMVTHPHNGPSRLHRIADREAGALKRIAAVLANHGTLWSYHQTDPRGCALYVGRVADLIEHGTGRQMDLASCYNRGIAVVIA